MLIIIMMIISKVLILKKSPVLYKEHDGGLGNWLMYMYKNETKQK